MKIKVCGLKDPENIEAIAALAPDYMGFIFYAKSPRFAADPQIEILNNIPGYVYKTAVFVNENADTISALINKYNFDAIQLHGSEHPDFCASFKESVTVIKAFGVNKDFNFDDLNPYIDKVDYFLFDTKTDGYGGSGMSFDWSVLNKYKLEIPFFLSGGLSMENLEEVKKIEHPQFYGIDLNSKFEISPGLKNIEMLSRAFDTLKQTQCK